MKIKFWGVRGSVPSPITPSQIQAKITAVVQRITQKDLVSPDAREKFIAKLPEWISETAGGNSACVELKADSGEEIVFDAGTGIRLLGKEMKKSEGKKCSILFSHFHWDHIQGFPFFDPIYDSKFSFDVYSGFPDAEKYLDFQQSVPYFPETASFKSIEKNISFHTEKQGIPFNIGNLTANICEMKHPGKSFAFSIEESGKKFVYATDAELSLADMEETPERTAVFKNADAIVLDSQYTIEESHRKENWGHSAFCTAIDFAVKWEIKSVYLFHHDPAYDDKTLDSILTSARWYAQYVAHSDIKVYLAKEGMEVEI